MSWEIQDRHLWIGFGIFLFVAVKGVERCLQTTIQLSEIYDPQHAKAANGTQAEDSISLEALSTLVTSPNQEISNAATSLLLSRFTQDHKATSHLTEDLFSPKPSVRTSAKRILDLFDTSAIDLYPLNDNTVASIHDKSDPTYQTMCRAYFKAVRKYRQVHESPAALDELRGDADDAGVSHAAGRARFQASSNHEAEVRRHRREAMVLHEGGGVIGSQDIIHPRTDGHS
ncbi:hypothetical protein KCU62_g5024, partial [Aureobasidium sp. EXF-3399]